MFARHCFQCRRLFQNILSGRKIEMHGALTGIRTQNQQVKSLMLYHWAMSAKGYLQLGQLHLAQPCSIHDDGIEHFAQTGISLRIMSGCAFVILRSHCTHFMFISFRKMLRFWRDSGTHFWRYFKISFNNIAMYQTSPANVVAKIKTPIIYRCICGQWETQCLSDRIGPIAIGLYTSRPSKRTRYSQPWLSSHALLSMVIPPQKLLIIYKMPIIVKNKINIS